MSDTGGRKSHWLPERGEQSHKKMDSELGMLEKSVL
jgi:hypothetical protein